MHDLATHERLESLVPAKAAHWASLHLVKYGDFDRALLFGHLVLSRIEAIEENQMQLQHLLATIIDNTQIEPTTQTPP